MGDKSMLRIVNSITADHYSDVILSAMASQITGVSIVYSTVCSGPDQKKTSKLRVTGVCEGNSPVTGNAETISIWWRHHVTCRHKEPQYQQPYIYVLNTTWAGDQLE